MNTKTPETEESARPLHLAGITLGVGLGGFLDGIVLHQILQWHHLVCRTATCEVHTVAEFKTQTFQDGLFHLGMWLVTALGVFLLFRAMRLTASAPRGTTLFGSMLVGWGSFNLVEGIIDHHILGIHHVLSGSAHQTVADWIFLAISALLVVGGSLLRRSSVGKL